MDLRAEVTIDFDEKRRVWSTAEATGVDPQEATSAAHALSLAASAGALDSYSKVAAHRPDLGGTPPVPKGPDMTTFGEDDD